MELALEIFIIFFAYIGIIGFLTSLPFYLISFLLVEKFRFLKGFLATLANSVGFFFILLMLMLSPGQTSFYQSRLGMASFWPSIGLFLLALYALYVICYHKILGLQRVQALRVAVIHLTLVFLFFFLLYANGFLEFLFLRNFGMYH